MNIEIRKLQISDRAQWETLWKDYLSFYKTQLDASQTDLTWQRLCNPQFNLHAFVAMRAGVMVGITHYLFHPSTWTEDDYCYLQDLFVLNEVRSKGIGEQLIKAVISAAKAHPAQRLYWLTQEENSTARKLYDKVATHTGFIQYRIAPL